MKEFFKKNSQLIVLSVAFLLLLVIKKIISKKEDANHLENLDGGGNPDGTLYDIDGNILPVIYDKYGNIIKNVGGFTWDELQEYLAEKENDKDDVQNQYNDTQDNEQTYENYNANNDNNDVDLTNSNDDDYDSKGGSSGGGGGTGSSSNVSTTATPINSQYSTTPHIATTLMGNSISILPVIPRFVPIKRNNPVILKQEGVKTKTGVSNTQRKSTKTLTKRK